LVENSVFSQDLFSFDVASTYDIHVSLDSENKSF